MTAYLTVEEAVIYFDTGRLGSDAWDCASATDRGKALVMATRAIDRLNYHGEKTDPDQTLQFPRLNDTEVPQDIKDACAEEALALLDGKDPEAEREALGITDQSFGPLKAKFDRETSRPINILHGIMSATAWSYILPYLRDPLTLRISRTS
jgi:hypothetical protein